MPLMIDRELNPVKRFGKRLQRLRKERHLTQMALSLRTGLNPNYISSMERGQENVGLVNICRLATGLGVDPSELVVRRRVVK